MQESPLAGVLVLLGATLVVVAALRRLRLPAILGFLAVGMALGPHALGYVPDNETTRTLGEFGIVFLLFTLGLEFSLPRLLAMRSEVFGLGTAQVTFTTMAVAGIALAAGIRLEVAIVVGGAVAMSSTAIVVSQLSEQGELNRTHGRLSFGILLFQDLAYVPFLALAATLAAGGGAYGSRDVIIAFAKAGAALMVVLVAGRWLLRPLFHEIARARLSELFTLAVLFVAMAAAWITHYVGLSLALGAFLAGMMLAETEYRYQVESGIRPFRDTLLGLFFVTVGMQLDVRLLLAELPLILAMLAGMLLIKSLVTTVAAKRYAGQWFKALRTAIVMAPGGEFGFALLAILLQDRLLDASVTQALVAAIVLSMVLSPFLIRHNRRIVRGLTRQHGPPASPLARTDDATAALAGREHVVLCGFGRVGQNVARVLESQGFEYIAMDLDPYRVRTAREAGDPVIFGDAADEQLLRSVGIDHASAVVISFSDPDRSIRIVESVRRLRQDVPVLVRTADDTRLDQLLKAGATEVVPETFEASLMLVSHTLLLLDVPMSRVIRTLGSIRNHRYSLLRSIFRREGAELIDESHVLREELHTVVLPPGAWSVGRTISEVRERGAEVSFTAVRRDGIVGRDPDPGMRLREGDVVVIYGTPEVLEHAEAVLLAG